MTSEDRKPYGAWDASEAMNFIATWEGKRLVAYKCSAGVWTIGFGHTKGVKEGDRCTNAEALAWLVSDISDVTSVMRRYVNVSITRAQFIALTSLAFNVGPMYVIAKCPRLMRALNSKRWEDCADEFLDIDKVNGLKIRGLTLRREAEAELFLS